MINIKNFTIFKCSINESFHWSNLSKLKELMTKEIFNLSNANLHNAFLFNANLSNAKLSHSDLSYSDLSNSKLSYSDLSYSDLRYSDLSYSDLRYSDLRYSYLSNSNLQNAELHGAKLKPIKDKEVTIEDFMSVIGLGSENRQTLIFKTNIGIVIQCGCFYGTENEFKEKVKETHSGTNYEKEYFEMVKLAKIRFNRED